MEEWPDRDEPRFALFCGGEARSAIRPLVLPLIGVVLVVLSLIDDGPGGPRVFLLPEDLAVLAPGLWL